MWTDPGGHPGGRLAADAGSPQRVLEVLVVSQVARVERGRHVVEPGVELVVLVHYHRSPRLGVRAQPRRTIITRTQHSAPCKSKKLKSILPKLLNSHLL